MHTYYTVIFKSQVFEHTFNILLIFYFVDPTSASWQPDFASPALFRDTA